MPSPSPNDFNSKILRSIVEHVFMPPQLPQEDPGEQIEQEINVALCDNLIEAAEDFLDYIPSKHSPLWGRMIKMMKLAHSAARVPLGEANLQRTLSKIAVEDVFVMHIRAQNAGLVVRRPAPAHFVQFEVFEVSPPNSVVMSNEGKLLCSYPGPAIQVPTDTFRDECFLRELSSFLVQMNVDKLDSTPTTVKAGSAVPEVRETADPMYISGLLVGILRGFGQPADVDRITKRIGDEVLWLKAYKPWRRSPLWLVLRVALQTSLPVDNLYKLFLLFFHAHLLRKSLHPDFPSELLYVMRVKMTRRLSKLGSAVPQHVYQLVHELAKEIEVQLTKRWKAFQELESISHLFQPNKLYFAADTHISLGSSYYYLAKILDPVSPRCSEKTPFNPQGSRIHPVRNFSEFSEGKLAKAIANDGHIAIMDFEFSVEKNLESWVAESTDGEGALDVIASCIQQYYAGTKKIYRANAEDNSIMILTIMSLWVELDKLATQQCPLLKEYPPGIPSEFLHDLLLHRSSTINRALQIEKYLCQRHKKVHYITSIFSNAVHGSCFAVKYYSTSEDLQSLHVEIEEHAQKERESKRTELNLLNQRSISLRNQASGIGCDHWRRHSVWTCEKCQLEREAESLTISVHEWPLPPSQLHAQRVVFELSPPHAFTIWRDITYMILRDIGLSSIKDSDSPDRPYNFLDTFSGLSRWAKINHRVSLGSTTKSFAQSHYKEVKIPTTESSVLVKNGLKYELFDRSRESWMIESFSKSSIAEWCIPPIDMASPYSPLHHFVSGTQHTSNDTIAAQADCPREISLHEFLAFSGLRSGPRLQWLNIARELASPCLSFRLEEVHTLVTHAAWQLGPLSNVSNDVRDWHIDLSISSFGNALLRELESLFERVKANWQEEVTVRTIALICSRLLASTTDSDISARACALLRAVRNETYRWIGTVSQKLPSTQDETTREGLQQRICMLAATCFSTFDVCPEHVPALLSEDEDFSIAMQCAIVVHDNTPPRSDDNPLYLTRMLSRHRRLLHDLEPIFLQSDQTADSDQGRLLHAGAYDLALSQQWPSFRRESSWHALPSPNSRWISCVTEGEQEVHYDLLTGQLLIDSKQLGRLPREIMEHSTYASVLRTKIFDVIPADINTGMDYVTKTKVSGYEILFSWDNGDLILQARGPGDAKKDSKILQLIPRSILRDDFPTCLIDKYVHWLDLSTGELEFRPAESPWTCEASNWRLNIQKHPRAVLKRPGKGSSSSSTQLIDIRSDTFRWLFGLLSPLERKIHVMATYTPATFTTVPTVEVSLPRFRLSFFVKTNWELECRSIPGYVVDKTQTCGTIFGLTNKLVLRPSPTSSKHSLQPRRVIIPEGKVFFSRNGNFTSVSIITDSKQHVRWHEYAIDTSLGCLTSNASLRSKLHQCYLHALTSHCLPDPLLGHTGTEEALYILQSASCRSFQRLDVKEAKLLRLIGDLTPSRQYYPHHLRSMATVEWNNLPALSQHHGFFQIVRSLFDHARSLEVLFDQPAVFDTSDRNETLLGRAASRNKSYYPSDSQNLRRPSSPDDVTYTSRDVDDLEYAEHVAFRTSWSIWNGRPSLEGPLGSLWDLMNSWRSLGPASDKISLGYSKYWLNIDAPRDWLVIYDLCRKAINGGLRNSRIRLCFSLSAVAYSESKYSDIIPFLVIISLDERFHNLNPPSDRSYSLTDGVAPEFKRLEAMVSEYKRPIHSTPVDTSQSNRRMYLEYNERINRESSKVAETLRSRWPNHKYVHLPYDWFEESDFNQRIKEYFQSISRNRRLREHVLQLQRIVQERSDVSMYSAEPYFFEPRFITSRSMAPSYSLHDVLVSRTNVPSPSSDGELSVTQVTSSDGLEILVNELQNSPPALLRLYGDELRSSHLALLGQPPPLSARGAVPPHEHLLDYHHKCSNRNDKLFSEMATALQPSQNEEKSNRVAGLWPRITPRTLLRLLAQDRIKTLPDQWKSVLMSYANALLRYRHSIRLLELSSGEKREELLREIEAIHDGVLAESTPDWLLVQIEANFVARRVQVDVAREMIAPKSGRNISLQLNMGEGKSSVIVPLVASTLADGSNLMRVVTLKPLANQMFQLLVSRLSGLANRPIFYIPFSRSLRMSSSLIEVISSLYNRCVAEGGVLVAQPEHILSQKLMHIDCLLTSNGNFEKTAIARELGDLQDWVAKTSRDVLDESDEILHVRYQLIYTSGEQMPVDDHPNRWTITQQVFGRLQAHAESLRAEFPKKFEMDSTTKGFPIIRVLDSEVSREISSLIIEDALGGGISSLPLGVLPLEVREAARRFMRDKTFSDGDRGLIYSKCQGTIMLKGILLLRGLLMDVEGIFGYVLKERRWRVDYGLDPGRTLLAVPYRAKDVPSLRAEFGHPDVAIVLTCLSYYYGGLTEDQMLLCFDLLSKLDNPEMEYDHWVVLGRDIPDGLRRLNGVNTEDKTQVDELLVPLFSKNKGVVDFYLAQVVFPRAAREFPSKLPTSAWDLVEAKKNVTTGFSGTNDNRYLLPTSIIQEDPNFVLGTNALVLRHLLLPENDHYECTEGDNGTREPATDFLRRLVKKEPEIRVLLDVGAQMLELRNEELARHWLSLRSDVSAAVFVNDSDHLTVVTSDGILEPFISSPFSRQLDKCVVYLDEAHTRGIDLKLPQGMRAAVTLGPKVTKDRLVQGCMRMRQLGKGHSVMFFAPGEVDRQIRNRSPSGDPVHTTDVLRWAMHETCEDIHHYLPYWVQQGLDHHKRFTAYKDYGVTGNLETLKTWLQPESRTLEEMYSVSPRSRSNPEIYSIPALSERVKRLGITEVVDTRIAEEQEREVDHEVEWERQVERPPKAQPAEHVLRRDICEFAETGKLPESHTHISPLLIPIDMADLTTEWSPAPLATADFTTTVFGADGSRLTDYLRPVNWILSSGSGKDSVVIVISPYEANELLPTIRKANKVRLHAYAPRVTASMRSFSDLTFYSTPDSPAETWTTSVHARIMLNLFAGQLYFDSKEEYENVCVLLALSRAHPDAKECQMDGFVPPKYRTGRPSPFAESKMYTLKMLMGLRRKGMGYYRTHLGQILNATPLSEETLRGL